MLTIEIPIEIPIETPADAAELADQYAVCTPTLHTVRVLASKATPVADTMKWHWHIHREGRLDGAHITIGDREWECALPPVRYSPSDTIEIEARRSDLPA